MRGLSLGLGFDKVTTAASAYKPTDEGPTTVWLDASDTTTLFSDIAGTTPATSTVALWKDKSGANNHASQSNSVRQFITGTQTLNGLNTLVNDGGNDYMQLPSAVSTALAGDCTIFIVHKSSTLNPSGVNFALYSANGIGIAYLNKTTLRTTHSAVFAEETTQTIDVDILGANILSMRSSGSIVNGYFNGVASASGPSKTTATDTIYIGADLFGGQACGGRYAEIIIYPFALTVAARQRVEAYLSQKWVYYSKVARLRAALAAIRAGTGNASVAMIGDSTTQNNIEGVTVIESWPYKLAPILNAKGINTQTQRIIGAGTYAGGDQQNKAKTDPRLTMGANWGRTPTGTGYASAGGYGFTTGVATDNLTLTATAIDNFRIRWWQQGGGNGAIMSYSIDGGAATNFNTGGADGWQFLDVPVSKGNHTLDVKFVSKSGGTYPPVYIHSLEAFDTTRKELSILNAGWSGSSTPDWLGTAAAQPMPSIITQHQPVAVLINLLINDWGQNMVQRLANIQTMIDTLKPTMDVILMTYLPCAIGTRSMTTQLQWVNGVRDLAAKNNLVLIDIFAGFGSYEADPTNYMTGDPIHPNNNGTLKMAQITDASTIFNQTLA